MNRRKALAMFGGTALTPLTAPGIARAQQTPLPVVGFLSGRSAGEGANLVAAFRDGLRQAGFEEGKQFTLEFRWAEGAYDRLPELAADLVRRKVALLVATGGPRAVLAAKAATRQIPIVFTIGGDPISLGVVTSLSHPGGNATGVSFLTFELIAKRLELLRAMVPRASIIALIVNPNTPSAESQTKAAREASRSVGLRLQIIEAGTATQIDAAFERFPSLRPGALLIGTDAFFAARSLQFIALAAQHAVPAIYEGREAVVAGGLMSYGPSLTEVYAQAGSYAGRILRGAKPADLPVLQPTKFELVINKKTAKALGLTAPPSLLLRADEVIE